MNGVLESDIPNTRMEDEAFKPSTECQEVIPKDRYHLAYWIFYLLGCGTLLPWNFFITANEYFSVKFQPEAELAINFQNYFSIASMAPNLVMMLLNVFFMHRFSRYIRILASIFTVMLMFGITSLFVLLNTEQWTRGFFTLTMVKMVVISISCSVCQGALFGMAGMFPSRYLQALMAGQALGGLLACAANIFSMIDESDTKKSAFGYFCTGTFVLMVSFVAYIFLERLEMVKYYTKDKHACFCNCKCTSTCHKNVADKQSKNILEMTQNEVNRSKSNPTDVNKRNQSLVIILKGHNYLEIFRQILPSAISVFIVFFVTLSVFPSTTARIKSTSINRNDWTDKFFIPVGCFLFYNLFDYIGRCLTSHIQIPSHKHRWVLVTLCCLRAVFLPLFVICNVQPRTNGSSMLFDHDAYPLIFMIFFSLSNGYLGSLAMMYGPMYVSSRHAEVAATALAFCIVAGLASGAAFSFVIAPNI